MKTKETLTRTREVTPEASNKTDPIETKVAQVMMIMRVVMEDNPNNSNNFNLKKHNNNQEMNQDSL